MAPKRNPTPHDTDVIGTCPSEHLEIAIAGEVLIEILTNQFIIF